MNKKVLRIVVICLAGVLIFGCSKQNQTGDKPVWPTTRNVEVILADGPASGTDAVLRVVTAYWTKTLGANFYVTNEAGGGGIVGFEKVRNGTKDGSSFLFTLSKVLLSYHFGMYDHPIDDFTIITLFRVPTPRATIVVRADSKYQTLKDLLDDAKARPNAITVPTDVGGTVLARTRIMEETFGVTFRKVDGTDNAGRIASLLGGFVDAVVITPASIASYIESGDLRVLCIFENERSPDFPDFPAVSEYGYTVTLPDPQGYLILGPKGMDEKIADAIAESLRGLPDDKNSSDAMLRIERSRPVFTTRAEAIKMIKDLDDLGALVAK
ncbi:MAG: tripartite tricarboxylate transporter substrate binding protein [Spirochaetaceae bacterium]|jgi:tripartite-type tricarboxylate transporter receptor subunit TctC|nr:tripartite tricarboxylate transporter substrate binding protein [Spirochaetaceae bacterium]